MDSEAALVRSEMSQTRAELDYKISQLQRKMNDMTPRAVASRYMPERAWDYAIGAVLTLIGARMAWKQVLARRDRRRQLVTSLEIHPI